MVKNALFYLFLTVVLALGIWYTVDSFNYYNQDYAGTLILSDRDAAYFRDADDRYRALEAEIGERKRAQSVLINEFSQKLKEVQTKHKCEGCSIDPGTKILVRPPVNTPAMQGK